MPIIQQIVIYLFYKHAAPSFPFSQKSSNHNSSLSRPSLCTSGIAMIFTTKLVHPVKCCVRWPSPVSGLYCSHAKPVRSHSRNTLSTRFFRRSV